MINYINGKPENNLNILLLFAKPVALADDERLLAGFVSLFNTRVTLSRYSILSVLTFEDIFLKTKLTPTARACKCKETETKTSSLVCEIKKLKLIEQSIVKPFTGVPACFGRELAPDEADINNIAKFYISYREMKVFDNIRDIKNFADEHSGKLLYEVMIKWLLALSKVYPECIGIYIKHDYETIVPINDLKNVRM